MTSTARIHQSTPSSASGGTPSRRGFRSLLAADSPLWLVLVAVLFTLAELGPSLLKMPLGADEMTYIAQTSAHASGVVLPPVHSRGPGILAAPVTLLTTSLLALRLWMAILSGIGLLLALLSWRGLRPAWVLAIAGFILGSLGIAQLSGVQAMPDWWVALGALTVMGLFMQAVTGRMRPKVILPLLAFATFFLVLQRVQDAVFLMGPVVLAILIAPAWRQLRVLAAIVIGLAAGALEWVVESYLTFGGVLSRLHQMHQEPPKFGFYFTLPYQLKVLNGPWYCRPGACHTWNYPWLTVWWLALLALAIIGVAAVRGTSLGGSVLVLAAALSLLLAYTLFVPYAAPRYLLPVIALMTLPAADGAAWLVTRQRWKIPAIAALAVFLLSGAVTQHLVRGSETRGQDVVRHDYISEAQAARVAGAHLPCVDASPSVGYYLGCAAPWTGESVTEVLGKSAGGVHAWHQVPGVKIKVYVRN